MEAVESSPVGGKLEIGRPCIPWFMDGDFSLPAAEFNSLDREDPPASEGGSSLRLWAGLLESPPTQNRT